MIRSDNLPPCEVLKVTGCQLVYICSPVFQEILLMPGPGAQYDPAAFERYTALQNKTIKLPDRFRPLQILFNLLDDAPLSPKSTVTDFTQAYNHLSNKYQVPIVRTLLISRLDTMKERQPTFVFYVARNIQNLRLARECLPHFALIWGAEAAVHPAAWSRVMIDRVGWETWYQLIQAAGRANVIIVTNLVLNEYCWSLIAAEFNL